MGFATCNLINFDELRTAGKEVLGSLYNESTFNAVMQNYYDKHKSLPNKGWIKRWLRRKFNAHLNNGDKFVISSQPYKKGDPQNNPDVAHVYNENAQAASAIHEDVENPVDYIPRGGITTNVRDAADTGIHNTAVIRTDSEGKPTENAFGLIVKLYQQDRLGKYVGQAGCFTDSDEHFELFKMLNEQVFNRLKESGLEKIVFPSAIAMGRAALPERFAEWLALELEKRYDLKYKVDKNKTPGYNGYGLVANPSQKNFAKSASQKDNPRRHWAQFVGKDMGFEVSDVADTELGKMFSPTKAVLPEGTVFMRKIKGETVPLDLSGYCIDAAWAILKGYPQAGKKGPVKHRSDIIGYNGNPLKGSVLDIMEDKENKQFAIYKWLWEKYLESDSSLKEKLLEATDNGKKVLTDKFAGYDYGRHKLNQARALAEILFGKSEKIASPELKIVYERQFKNAQKGAEEILSEAKRTTSGVKVVKYGDEEQGDYSKEFGIVRMVKNLDERGNKLYKDGFPLPSGIITFKMPKTVAGLDYSDSLFINPFEGEEDALRKFLLWLLPDDFNALPDDLRRPETEKQRRSIRITLSNGNYRGRTFYTNDTSEEGLRYIDVLRYVIDNFETLKEKYNPVSENAFAHAYTEQNVILTGTLIEEPGKPVSYNAYLNEDGETGNKPSRNVEIVKNSSNDYILKLNIPKGRGFSNSEMKRLAKAIATSIPNGKTLTVTGATTQLELTMLDLVASYGFLRTDRTSTITDKSGNKAEAPTYIRNTQGKEQVVRQRSDYNAQEAFDKQETHVYLFSGNFTDMRELEKHPEDMSTRKHAGKEGTEDTLRGLPNAIEIPVKWNRGWSEESSHLKDSDFDIFKEALDKALNQARKAVSQGKTIIVPARGIGFTSSEQLQKQAPRIWQYLQEQMANFEAEANYLYNAEQNRKAETPTVDVLETSPKEAKDVVDVKESAYTVVHREFNGRGVLMEAVSYVADVFVRMLEKEREDLVEEYRNAISQLSENDPKQADEYYETEAMLRSLDDALIGAQIALGRVGTDSKAIVSKLSKLILGRVPFARDSAAAELFRKTADVNNLNVLLQYAAPYIEERCGVRILIAKGAIVVREAQTEEQKADNYDDPEGKRTSGANDWSYNVRLSDPYKSLSRSVRRALANIPMYDPNEPMKDGRPNYLRDSYGNIKKYDPKFIYTCLMSFMAKNYRNRPETFITFEEAPETDSQNLNNDKKHFPLGMPKFPLLEQMANTYVWAKDLIKEFQKDYKYDNDSADEAKRISAGNLVSQFLVNFNQQFISYYVMRDGHLYAENQPTGEESLKQSVMTNYEGGVRLVGNDGQYLDMVYNFDQSVNQENVDKAVEKIEAIQKILQNRGENNFWTMFNSFKKDTKGSGKSNLDVYNIISTAKTGDESPLINRTRYKDAHWYYEMCVNTSDVLKSMGVDMSAYDVMCVMLSDERDISLGMLLVRISNVLTSLKNLTSEDHMISSAKSSSGNINDVVTVEKTWNTLFHSFGEYVNDRELQASFRSKDGNTRYSYSAPSFLSTMLMYLSDSDDNLRRSFIDENFKYDPMFWDANAKNPYYRPIDPELEEFGEDDREDYEKNEKGWWRNQMLKWAYVSPLENDTHDLIGIYKSDKFQEYADWTPEMIEDMGLREYYNGTSTGNNSLFVIPILSDHECCKVVGMPLDSSVDVTFERFVEVVHQELDRMRLVEKRNKLMKLQEEYEKDPKAFEKEERRKDLEDLQKHRYIFDIANFDTRGNSFQFIPELETMKVSEKSSNVLGLAAGILNVVYNRKPESTYYTLSEMVDLFNEMDPEVFLNTMLELNIDLKLGSNTREFLDAVIYHFVEEVFVRKFTKWAYKGGNAENGIRKNLEDSLVTAMKDTSLQERRKNLPYSETGLTAEQKKVIDDYNNDVKRELFKFYVNHAYAMSQLIQVMSTDVAYYDGSVDFSKRWYSVYGSGQHLNTSSKYGKKTENYIIVKDNKRMSQSIDVLKEAIDKAVAEGRISKVDGEAVINKFKKINGTDAQAYRSLTSYRSLMDMAGRWTPEMEKCYNNLRAGHWTMSDFYTLYQTVKPFTFSTEPVDSGFDSKLRVPTIHKNSESVLLAIYVTLTGSEKNDKNYSPRLVGINKAMEEIELVDENGKPVKDRAGNIMRAIDLVQYESSTKISKQGVVDLNYSPHKLELAKGKGELTYEGYKGEKVDIFKNDTYYDIIDRLDAMFSKGKITGAEYNELVKQLDFTSDNYYNGKDGAQEVRDIIEKAIRSKGNDISGTDPSVKQEIFNSQVLHSVSYSNYMFQVATPNHFIDNSKGTFGSQIRHLVLSDIPDTMIDPETGEEVEWKITIGEGDKAKTYTRDQIRKHYNDLIIANLIEAYTNDIDRLFHDDPSDKRPMIYRLRDRLIAIINESDRYGRDLVQALDIVEDPDTHKPTFALPLNNINVTVKLEEILLSFFKNSISKQHMNGGNAILAADIGYADSLKVLGERDADGKLTKITGVECYLPASMKSLYKHLLKKKEDGTYEWKLSVDKLKEMGLDKIIGYRIPTEGLYSAMPLIVKGFLPQQSGSSIVIAQEVTTFTGSDNDVDKMFLFIKSLDDKTMRPVEYFRRTKDEMEHTKPARDNEIIDIMQALITHPTMSDKWIHPGNFDNIKLNAKRLRIIKDSYLLKAYANVNRLSEEGAIQKLRSLGSDPFKDAKHLSDFLEKHESPKSPIYFDTFVRFHAQNMAGVAEKGIFANNNILHAKLQWADVGITQKYQFNMEDRHIDKLDDRYIKLKSGNKSIQENCAECGAAAVDNAKDPCLFDINCNVNTAPIFGFMLRMGLTIEEASLLLAQPEVDWIIYTKGKIRSKDLVGRGGKAQQIAGILKDDYKLDVNTDKDCDWHTHNFTKDELYANIAATHKIIDKYTKAGSSPELSPKDKEILKSMYRTYCLIADILDMQQDFSKVARALYYDSPTHAVARSMAGVVLQTKVVEDLNNRKYQSEDTKFFTGIEDLVTYYIDKDEQARRNRKQDRLLEEQAEFFFGKKNRKTRNRELFEKLSSSKLPIPQAFYTLGIEKAREAYGKHFLFGRDEVQDITDRLCTLMDQRYIFKLEEREKILTKAYQDFIVYMLTKTELFGDDEDFSYDEKRQYYLYKFPSKFLKLVSEHPELKNNEAVRRLTVEFGQIKMLRQGQLTTTMRDILMDSFDKMIHSKKDLEVKLAADLFMYTYYLNGFEFSYMSYGNLMGTQFLTKFPDYIQALRRMQKAPITEVDIDRFYQQFLIKRNNMGLLEDIQYDETTSDADFVGQNGYFNSGRDLDYYGSEGVPKFIRVNQELFYHSRELSMKYGSLCFVPLQSATTLHYNANQTIEEMIRTVYDANLIKENKKTGAQTKYGKSLQDRILEENSTPDQIPPENHLEHPSDPVEQGGQEVYEGEDPRPMDYDGIMDEGDVGAKYPDINETINEGDVAWNPEQQRSINDINEVEGQIDQSDIETEQPLDIDADVDSIDQFALSKVSNPVANEVEQYKKEGNNLVLSKKIC